MNEDRLTYLNNLLQTRVRYLYRWQNASVSTPNKREFIIKYYGDTVKTNGEEGFEFSTYPISDLETVIKKQEAKLKKDIPEIEKKVLKGLL